MHPLLGNILCVFLLWVLDHFFRLFVDDKARWFAIHTGSLDEGGGGGGEEKEEIYMPVGCGFVFGASLPFFFSLPAFAVSSGELFRRRHGV